MALGAGERQEMPCRAPAAVLAVTLFNCHTPTVQTHDRNGLVAGRSVPIAKRRSAALPPSPSTDGVGAAAGPKPSPWRGSAGKSGAP